MELDDAAPGAQAAGGTLTCDVTSIQLQGTGNGSFDWTGPGGFTSSDQNPTVSVAGTYDLTVTGANGCQSFASAEVELDDAAPGAQAAGGTLTCDVTSIQLQGTGNGSFAWTGPGGFTSNDQNPTVSVAGTYDLTVTGANGCQSFASAEVELDDDAPGAQAAGGTLTCDVTSIQLQGTGNGSFAWTGPGGFTSNDQNPTVSVAGTYDLTVTGANGCQSFASAEVELDNDVPQANVTATLVGCEDEPALLSFTSNSAIALIEWIGPGGLVSTMPTASTSIPGAYTLILTGPNGCSNEFSIEVQQDTDCDKDCGPMIIKCPADVTVQCADDFSPDGLGGWAEWRDKKKEDCPEITGGGWYDEFLSVCPYVIRRTWWAEDEYGNYETCTQFITVIDEVAPIFYDVPTDITVSCDSDIDGIEIPAVTAYDECMKAEVEVKHDVTVLPGKCAGSYSIVHTWTAVDQCDNAGTATWTINVRDTEAPVLTCDLEDLVIECDELPEPVECEATDNCDSDVEVTVEDVKGDYGKDCKYTVTRTYTATDDCGNSTSVTQSIVMWCPKKDCDNFILASKMSASASPNPFREQSTITFTAAESGVAQVVITDLMGRRVAELFTGHVEKDVPMSLTFQPTEKNGGTFLYRIQLNGQETIGRLMAQP
ncbi:MAG: hypothetical protein IPM46_06515 [Flavobacteriales bacterium]|nr:hypothetical protein [Flavobacteriales bacterium]